jgi:hypothetical protein
MGAREWLRKEFRTQLGIAEGRHQAEIVLMFSEDGAKSELRNLRYRLSWGDWGNTIAELGLIGSGQEIIVSRQLPNIVSRQLRGHAGQRDSPHTPRRCEVRTNCPSPVKRRPAGHVGAANRNS